MGEKAIIVENLSKVYDINHNKKLTIAENLSNIFSTSNNVEKFYALNDISFSMEKGETLGIIGRNGAGKSTLLKILSRITPPTSGKAIINGRVASLLEVGTGFHGELTGRENVYLNGSLHGMKKKEIDRKFDEIVDFSGVENFIDTQIKNYSSGMQVRLAFAVAAHLEPEILILDEVFAVGDAEFQRKCIDKIGNITYNGITVLLVSHNLGTIEDLCKKTMILDKGQIIINGETKNAINQYNQLLSKKNINNVFNGGLSSLIELTDIFFNNFHYEIEQHLNPLLDNQIALHFEHKIIEDFRITISFYKHGIRLFSLHDVQAKKEPSKNFKSIFIIPKLTLRPGLYDIGIGGHTKDQSQYFWNDQVVSIYVKEIFKDTYEYINIGAINVQADSKRVSI